MERPHTQDEQRKAEFDKRAAAAKELGDKALHDLDAVLLENERVWEDLLRLAGGEQLTHDQVMAIMWNRMHPERHSSPNFYV